MSRHSVLIRDGDDVNVRRDVGCFAHEHDRDGHDCDGHDCDGHDCDGRDCELFVHRTYEHDLFHEHDRRTYFGLSSVHQVEQFV